MLQAVVKGGDELLLKIWTPFYTADLQTWTVCYSFYVRTCRSVFWSGMVPLAPSSLSNYHSGGRGYGGSMLLFLPRSLRLDGSPAAHSAASRQRRRQRSLHNPQFQFFPPSSLCNLFHACHTRQDNFLHHMLHQFSTDDRTIWSPDLFGLVAFRYDRAPMSPRCCIYYPPAGYLEVQVRTLCHLMLTANAAKHTIH